MNLRLRLRLGYGYLVALLVVTATSAVIGFLELSAGIDRVLDDNMGSIRAAVVMVETLERQDSASLAALVAPSERGRPPVDAATMRQLESAFGAALEEAAANTTEKGESALVDTVRDAFADYQRARRALVETAPAQPLAAYEQQVYPAFSAVKERVMRLLEINHDAMQEADRRSREAAVRNAAWLGFLVVVALLSLIILTRALHRQLIEPLDRLTATTTAIARGDVHRRVPRFEADELAAVADQLNAALDVQSQLRAQMLGRLAEHKQLTLALLARRPAADAALVALDGELLAATSARIDSLCERRIAGWAEDQGKLLLGAGVPEAQTLDFGEPGSEVRATLLTVAPERPVAWLVEIIPEAS